MKYIISLFLFFMSCSQDKPLKEITLGLDWSPNTRHLGFYIAKEKGFYQDEGLSLRIWEGGSRPEIGVGADKLNFAISFIEETAFARKNGLPLIGIAAIVRKKFTGWAVSRENITNFKQLEGNRYGAWGGVNEIQRLKKRFNEDGADFNSITILQLSSPGAVPFGIDSPNAPDFVNTYKDWAYTDLRLRGKKVSFIPTDIQEKEEYYSPIIVTSSNFLIENPETVQKFLRATEKGYRYAVDNPEESIDILMKTTPEYKKEFLLASLEVLRPSFLAKDNSWGIMNPAVWQEYIDVWIAEGALPKDMKAEQLMADFAIKK